MNLVLPPQLALELEQKYFWWQAIGARSNARIIAQAMDWASFADIRRIEREVGPDQLVDLMLHAEPGWLSERSWEFWRGRLSTATGRSIPEQAPRRSLHAAAL